MLKVLRMVLSVSTRKASFKAGPDNERFINMARVTGRWQQCHIQS